MNNATQAQLLATLAQLLGVMPASVKVSRKTKTKARKIRRSEDQLKADLTTACRKAGIKGSVEPRVNVLTYDGWLAKGRRVKAGQKGLPGFNSLFHVEQTDVEASA